jgi:hypothetical protein
VFLLFTRHLIVGKQRLNIARGSLYAVGVCNEFVCVKGQLSDMSSPAPQQKLSRTSLPNSAFPLFACARDLILCHIATFLCCSITGEAIDSSGSCAKGQSRPDARDVVDTQSRKVLQVRSLLGVFEAVLARSFRSIFLWPFWTWRMTVMFDVWLAGVFHYVVLSKWRSILLTPRQHQAARLLPLPEKPQ